MVHIKTQMLAYTSLAILFSCLLTNIVYAVTFSNLYLEELYISCENQAKQVLQNVDQRVQTLEDSVTLVLGSQEIVDTLNQTNFKHQDGRVFEAYQILDQSLQNFRQRFSPFIGMLFINERGELYQYNYYNPDSTFLADFLTEEKKRELTQTDSFNWENVYQVQNRLDTAYAYVVTKCIVNRQNLKNIGVAILLLEEDIFSSIYQGIQQTTGGKVFLFDRWNQPAEIYEEESMALLQQEVEDLRLQRGETRQVKTKNNGRLYTLAKSQVTGWTVCVEIPMDMLTVSIQRLILTNALLSVLIIAAVALLEYRYISEISHQIVQISQAMQMVEKNNFTLRLHTNRRDEIGIINNGFNTMSENLAKYFEKAVQEEKSRNQAEIRALFYQIKPHFLYNTLASIRMYAMKQGYLEIVDILGTLNRLLRNTINVKDRLISLQEELRNLEDYMTIFNIRYENRIHFQIAVPEKLLTLEIPNMILQPIVENAIEHGISGRIYEEGWTGRIQVEAERKEGDLWIWIEDNGVGMTDMELAAVLRDTGKDGEYIGHIGIQNIDSRLKNLYGQQYGVFIESEKGCYTRVNLRVKAVSEKAEDRS